MEYQPEYYLRDLADFNETLEAAMDVNTTKAAQDLLNLEAMPQGRDANSALLLGRILCCYTGRDTILEEVVGEGARERGLQSLLHLAATEGYEGIAHLLLEWGADPNESDVLQRSALHMAAACGHRGVAFLLLRYGADVGARHCSGKTALHFAAEGSDDAQLVGALLDLGLDVNDADRIHRSTPLHLAAWNGRPKVARLLLDRGADLHARNAQGCLPVHLGAKTKQVLELLMERGADLKCADARRHTPLMWIDVEKVEEGKLIISSLVKDAALGIPEGDENARFMEYEPVWRRIRDECIEEIITMKEIRCYREMTCYDVFALSASKLAIRMRNRRLSHTLLNLRFEDCFNIYGCELKKNVIKAHEAKAHMHRAMHFVTQSVGDYLPFAVIAKIGEYLIPKDVMFR